MKTQFTINQDTFNSYAFELAKDDLYKVDRTIGGEFDIAYLN